jgi:hypothetical protein
MALSEAALVKLIKEYIRPNISSRNIDPIIKLIFILKINNSNEIKAINACVLNKNKPNDPIKNRENDNKKKINIVFF